MRKPAARNGGGWLATLSLKGPDEGAVPRPRFLKPYRGSL